MSAPQVEFGFVAALEREVSGLVRDWSRTKAQSADASWPIYCNQRAALILAGTGAERARTAAKLLIEKFAPRVLISIGFAGSCRPDLRPGELMVPESLVEASTGRTCHCAFGQGQLVTLDRVAGKGLKQQAAARFGAWAVDMEAAGVAAAAAESSMDFAAIKAISDGSGEDSVSFPASSGQTGSRRDGSWRSSPCGRVCGQRLPPCTETANWRPRLYRMRSASACATRGCLRPGMRLPLRGFDEREMVESDGSDSRSSILSSGIGIDSGADAGRYLPRTE